MKTFIAYVRVSTAYQGSTGVSLAEQQAAIERYAAERDLIVIDWCVETKSAAGTGRQVFGQVIERILEAPDEFGLIMHKIDRGARNLKDWATIGELVDQGVDVRLVHDGMDLRSRSGRLSADIQAVVAADYVRNLREEALKGFYGRLKQGLYPMPAPLGYRNCGRGKVKVPDENARFVAEIFTLYATGRHSLYSLCQEMRRRGLRNHCGGFVSINGMSTILRNPFYTGTIRVKRTGEEFPGIHTPIVSKQLFRKVQEQLRARGPKKRRKYAFRFSRRIRCTCGYSLVGELQKSHTYYRCHHCRGVCVREEMIDAAVIEALKMCQLGTELEFSEVIDQHLGAETESGLRRFIRAPHEVYVRSSGKFRTELSDILVEAGRCGPEYLQTTLSKPFRRP